MAIDFLPSFLTYLDFVRSRWRIKVSLSDYKWVLDLPKDIENYDTSGTPYDYLSIMHYTETAFGKRDKNGRLLTTIEILDKRVGGYLLN